MADDRSPSRRTVLGLTGGLFGAAALGGFGLTETSADTATQAPAVEWASTYPAQDRKFQEQDYHDIVDAPGDGVALLGRARPVERSGAQEYQFMVLRTTGSGEVDWVAFADPDVDSEELWVADGVATADDAFAMVGDAWVQEDYGTGEEEKAVAHAAKVTDDGEAAWTRTFDPQEDPDAPEGGLNHRAQLDGALATADGGLVACGYLTQPDEDGSRESSGWLVKLAADGSTEWERTYSTGVLAQVREYGDGYVTVSRTADTEYEAYVLDGEGQLQRTVTLGDLGTDSATVITTDDGGFAYTGEQNVGGDTDLEERNVILGKLDEAGSGQWYKEFDGPAKQADAGQDLVQTADGGFAVAGYMSEAYSTDHIAAFVRTGADGNQRWRKLVDEYGPMENLVRTADGGLAAQGGDAAIKLGPPGEADGTATASPTATGTATATETATARETTTDSDTGGQDGRTDGDTGGGSGDVPETATTTPTDTATDADAGGEEPDDEDDCVI